MYRLTAAYRPPFLLFVGKMFRRLFSFHIMTTAAMTVGVDIIFSP